MFKITSSKDNAVAATYQYLKAIGAKVTEETVEETLKNHPDYPSLLATSDAFNDWKIENVAARLEPEQLATLPTPFLTHLYVDGGIFALVKSVKNDAVEWIHTKEGFKRDKTEEFLHRWNGVVLVAETNTASGESDFSENRKKEILNNLRIPFVLIGTLILTISLFYLNFTSDWHYNTLLLTKFAGIIVSSLLLWQTIDKNNPFIKAICTPSSSGKGGVGCNAILSSKAAQVTSWLSWSEVGFFYFAGGFITLLINPNSMFLLLSLGAAALCYTFWSIYYQSFIAKQWCVLCLTVQLILVVEFLLNANYLSELAPKLLTLIFSDLSTPSLGLGSVVLVWIFIKPFLQKSQQVAPLKNDLQRFKSNPNLFLSLLEKQSKMPLIPSDMPTVMIGNSNAKHTITMISNPFCQPCTKTHKTLEKLLSTNDNLDCQVIFVASNKENDPRGTVARLILSLPSDQQAEALHRWYENEERSIEKWKQQLDIVENENSKIILTKHQKWCKTARIEVTPTIYLDGYKMPELYRLDDLNVLLKYLSTEYLQMEHN